MEHAKWERTMLCWLENIREKMMDEMQEEEYEKIKEAVLNGERKTEYTKDETEETEAKDW